LLLNAFIGLPWPKKIAGIGATMVVSFLLFRVTVAARP
jgi:hypothetical protein